MSSSIPKRIIVGPTSTAARETIDRIVEERHAVDEYLTAQRQQGKAHVITQREYDEALERAIAQRRARR